jgi:hypothetical protein
VIGQAVAPVKRRFGLWRKDHLPGARSPVVSITSLPAEMAGGRMITEPAVILVKRGPGRPRKVPLAAALAPVAPGGGPVSGLTGTWIAPELVGRPVKRKMGRPRKHPVTEPDRPERMALLPVSVVPAPGSGHGGAGIGPARPDAAGIARESPGRVESGNNDGIGFWPPHPDEARPVRPAATGIGFVTALKRGRRLKAELSPVKAPARRRKRSLGPAVGGGRAFCGKCGTYIRMFRPARGRWRRVCPKCHPEKMLETRRPGVNLDKSGMPCKDRGTCRPVRCLKAFDCEEMRRNR